MAIFQSIEERIVIKANLANWLDTNSGHIFVALILVVFGSGIFAGGDADTRTLARDIVMGALGVMWRSMNSGQSAKQEAPPSQ